MAGGSERKRRDDNGRPDQSNKRNKTKNYWKSQANSKGLAGIEAGKQGIFATCDKGREGNCVVELTALLDQCVSKLYGGGDDGDGEDDGEDEDIAASIDREMAVLRDRDSQAGRAFVSVKLDVQCVVFFRTAAPCVPTDIVSALCRDAAAGAGALRSRFTHKLTPVSRTARATPEGLADLAKTVLGPRFHGQEGVKFAIRPTTRNHNVLDRDQIIKIVADVVGPKHKVDLKNYDVLILVELYQHMCGMSVVTREWEELKKYNLAQLQDSYRQQQQSTKAEDEDEGDEGEKAPRIKPDSPK